MPWDAGMQATQGTFDTESGPFAAGKKVLVASGCFRCHTVNGVRGPVGGGPPAGGFPGGGGPPMPGGPGRMMGGRAPDLGEVGKDPTHTMDWVMKYVRNPKSVKPEARMPQFEGRIKDEDLRALAEYLASLK
jgi:cbb3-type cytochrome oxidase cytochrome c subunit